MKDFLYEGLILKEKDFREQVENLDVEIYENAFVYLYCSTDAIVPLWAYCLDIFQHYEMNDAFTFANRLQQYRPCKAFEVTFIKHKREAEGE